MDRRVASKNPLLFRSHPKTTAVGLALIFLAATALTRPESSRTGHFLGTLKAAPVTIETDAGTQLTEMNLDLVLDVSSRGYDSHSVSMRKVALKAPGVPTGDGKSGALDGDFKASGTVPVAPDGRVNLPVTVTLHYPLIDRVFPPSPEPYRETFGGTVTGTLTFHPEKSAYTFQGTLHLTVRGAATGKLIALDIPLESVDLYPDSAAA
jgi:hypothetical protein